MTIYILTVMAGLVAAVLAFRGAKEEGEKRRAHYCKRLHTRFVCCGNDTVVDLYRTHYIIGRRKRRCDLSLDGLKDQCISRVHAVLWYDGKQFCIASARNRRFRQPDKYPEVYVNGLLVPMSGIKLRCGDMIRMGNSYFVLEDTAKEE